MERTYKIMLPKGAKVYSIDAKVADGTLNVTVSIDKKYIPKDGDIVHAEREKDGRNYKWIFICKGTNTDPYSYCEEYTSLGIEQNGEKISELSFNGYCDAQKLLCQATEAEKLRLFDALAKEGKRWNAEKKCIENLPRWRALYNEDYYVMGSDLNVYCQNEIGHVVDDNRYNVGNYFRTHEAAEEVVSQIRDIFKNSKAG